MRFHLVSLLLLQFVLGYAPFEHKSTGQYPLKMKIHSGQLPKVVLPMIGVPDGGICGRLS